MNPIWIKNNEIDRQKWDTCINICAWGKIYSLSFYLDNITNYSWEALILGDYEYIMPVPLKSKAGIKITYRPDFCQQLGVFSKNENIENDILVLFLYKLYERFKTFIYPLNHKNLLSNSGFIKCQKRTNFVLKLDKNYNEIFENYSNELKRNLKRAEKLNLQIDYNISSDVLIKTYKDSWQSRYQISESVYSGFKKIIDYSMVNKTAQIIAVKYENRILSACAIFFFKDRIYYPFSAITPDGKKFHSTEYMINEILAKHSQSPLTLDFEGSDISSVNSFYRKFSPTNEPYFQITKNVYFLEKIIFFRIFLKNVLHFRKM